MWLHKVDVGDDRSLCALISRRGVKTRSYPSRTCPERYLACSVHADSDVNFPSLANVRIVVQRCVHEEADLPKRVRCWALLEILEMDHGRAR
jgi:hypothetical protein